MVDGQFSRGFEQILVDTDNVARGRPSFPMQRALVAWSVILLSGQFHNAGFKFFQR